MGALERQINPTGSSVEPHNNNNNPTKAYQMAFNSINSPVFLTNRLPLTQPVNLVSFFEPALSLQAESNWYTNNNCIKNRSSPLFDEDALASASSSETDSFVVSVPSTSRFRPTGFALMSAANLSRSILPRLNSFKANRCA